MPTGSKFEKALATAKGLSADLQTFSQDTDDKQAKQMFNQLSITADNIPQTIENRLNFVQSEEPQYKK